MSTDEDILKFFSQVARLLVTADIVWTYLAKHQHSSSSQAQEIRCTFSISKLMSENHQHILYFKVCFRSSVLKQIPLRVLGGPLPLQIPGFSQNTLQCQLLSSLYRQARFVIVISLTLPLSFALSLSLTLPLSFALSWPFWQHQSHCNCLRHHHHHPHQLIIEVGATKTKEEKKNSRKH